MKGKAGSKRGEDVINGWLLFDLGGFNTKAAEMHGEYCHRILAAAQNLEVRLGWTTQPAQALAAQSEQISTSYWYTSPRRVPFG